MEDKFRKKIPNFHSVSRSLYRGGQPPMEQIGELEKAGIKTIVNLRSRLKLVERERQWVEETGMRYHSYPLRYWLSPGIAVHKSSHRPPGTGDLSGTGTYFANRRHHAESL